MGWITTVTVNNDFMHELTTERPEKVCEVATYSNKKPMIHVPVAGITVVETHHADYGVPVLVGGGKEAQVITDISVHYTNPDPELTLLKNLALKHGYSLRKKPNS